MKNYGRKPPKDYGPEPDYLRRIRELLPDFLLDEKVPERHQAANFLFKAALMLGMLFTLNALKWSAISGIPFWIKLIVYFLPGFIITPFFHQYFEDISPDKGHWTLHIIAHGVAFGSILLILVAGSDVWFASDNVILRDYEITQKEYDPGNDENDPRFRVYIKGENVRQEYSYPEEMEAEIEAATKIVLFVRTGLWGYEFVENHQLE